jgi:aspartate/methionine/tyrosine aminotransferase
LVSRTEVVSRAIERLLEEYHASDRVMLGGSPAVALPTHVVEAARSAAGDSAWAGSTGVPALRSAIAERLTAEGAAYRTGEIVVTNGAMQALDLCFRTLLTSGDEVLCPEPRFFIDGLVDRAEGALVGFPSPEVAGFRPDWEAARSRVTARTRVLFLNSPTNPTGYVYDDDDIDVAARLADEHDLWVVSDESYAHFVYRGRRHRSVATHELAADRTVVVRSFSKDYAMPGWRIGYAAAPARLVASLAETLEWSCLAVSRIGQAVALAALRGPHDWVDEAVGAAELYATTFARDINAIPGLSCRAPDGGLNLLVRPEGDATSFVRDLVMDAGVPAHPGEAFGADGSFRLQFGGTDAARRAAIERLAVVASSRHLGATPASGEELLR